MVVEDQILTAPPAAAPLARPRAAWLQAIWRREWLVVLLIAAWTIFLLAWRLPDPSGYIYDEVYHAYTGNLMAHNDPRVYEWWQSAPQQPIKGVQYEWTHPPLGKLIIGGSIVLFGNNSLGWRFSNAVFGVICVLLVYTLARVLFRDRVLATFAALIISVEGLMFAESRIGTNDIFQLAFLLVAYICFAKFFHRPARSGIGWLFLTGIFLGLGFATKWPSLYSIGLLSAVAAVRAVWPDSWTRAWQRPATAVGQASLPASSREAASPCTPATEPGQPSLPASPTAPAPSPQPPSPYAAAIHADIARARTAYSSPAAAGFPPVAGNDASVEPQPRWGFFARIGYLIAAFVALVLLPVGEYILSYLQMFLQHHQIPENYAGVGPFKVGPLPFSLGPATLPNSDWWNMFVGEQWQMWHYHTTLTASHPYYSKWWQWLLDIRPVFYYVNRDGGYVANTYNLGNPLLYWIFPLAIVATVILIWKRRDLALLLIFGGLLINWLPWALSPRGMFFYHFLPSVPFLVLMVAYGLTRMWRSGSRWLARLAVAYTVVVFVSFAFFYTQLAAWPVPEWYANLHYWLPSWQ